MRYAPDHKQLTRERIVRAAGRRFRERGLEATAISDLMGDLRLTHGGFYRHFGGKDELIDEALAEAIRAVSMRLESVALAAPARQRAAAVIDAYLSESHCTNVAEGCPVAALGSELTRKNDVWRDCAFAAATREHMARMANYLPGTNEEERVWKARALFSGMAGTLAIARAQPDPTHRRRFLNEARTLYKAAVAR